MWGHGIGRCPSDVDVMEPTDSPRAQEFEMKRKIPRWYWERELILHWHDFLLRNQNPIQPTFKDVSMIQIKLF
jgi:hypothetical protein